MNRATVQTLREWRGKQAGSMPASASNMLAVPFSAASQSFLNTCRLCKGSATILVGLAGMMPASALEIGYG